MFSTLQALPAKMIDWVSKMPLEQKIEAGAVAISLAAMAAFGWVSAMGAICGTGSCLFQDRLFSLLKNHATSPFLNQEEFPPTRSEWLRALGHIILAAAIATAITALGTLFNTVAIASVLGYGIYWVGHQVFTP